ncbi:hypothetical protein, partial [Brevundimonas sp.]|uniref:hypothetical protein n=1 Tax=Brevundimonas sp. TaxID=1871086 RepID=UPI0025B97244
MHNARLAARLRPLPAAAAVAAAQVAAAVVVVTAAAAVVVAVTQARPAVPEGRVVPAVAAATAG